MELNVKNWNGESAMWQDVTIGVRGYSVWCQVYSFGIYVNMWIESARYLHYLIYFENFLFWYNHFIIFIIILLFQGHIILFPIWTLTRTWPFWKRRNLAAILLAASGKAFRAALINTQSNESQQSRCQRYQRGLSGGLKADLERKFCYWEITGRMERKTREK